MQVTNKESFISTIYPAIVVNTDTSLDPDDKGRVQIYIPSVHYKYADVYEKYMEFCAWKQVTEQSLFTDSYGVIMLSSPQVGLQACIMTAFIPHLSLGRAGWHSGQE